MAKQPRVLAAALIALASLAASAAEVDIRLERVSLYQFARIVLGELLHEPYVLDGALIAAEDVATMDIRSIEPAAARTLLEGLLKSRGFELERQGRVTVVKRATRAAEPERLVVYRPKFRSVSYLQGAIRSFLPNGRFAGGGAMAPVGAGTASGAGSGSRPAGSMSTTQAGSIAAGSAQAQSAVSSVIPAQGPVLASQDVLVFEAAEAEAAKAEKLLAELDRPAREVVIRAYVFEVGEGASDGSAVSLTLNLLGGKLGASVRAASLPYSVGVRIGGIEAAFSLLRSDSRFRVVSSPTLRIRSGEHGKLSVGSEVPVLGAVSLSSTGQPVQSVEYRSSGVILDLQVEVLQEAVYLIAQQQVSSFVATTTGVNASPTLLKRDLTTNLGLKSGEIAIIGGLSEFRDSNARSGLPGILSFLGSRSREEARSELILLLEAEVVEGS